jgi:hypothetical protein
VTAEAGSHGSDLPAPYRSPWLLLARDLRAVAASLVLKLRELWRRNAAADLPRPRFWPAGAAPLFWPLLLMIGLSLPWLGWQRLASSSSPPHPAAGTLTPATPGLGTPAPAPFSGSAAEDVTAADEEGAAPAPGGSTPAPAPATPAVPVPVPVPADPGEATTPPPPAGPAPDSPEADSPEAQPPDPLRERLDGDGQETLIGATASDPARGALTLTLTPAFASLERETRQRRAEDWRTVAEETGYERLELVDQAGRPLGRTALVGSGMILLDPLPPP